MSNEHWTRVEEIFHQVREMDPAERASFLDDSCDDNLKVRAEVESLLAHGERRTDELRPDGAAGPPTMVNRGPVAEGPGTSIGPYKVLQQIGEGGFGVVYMAEQREPVRRMVALKVIKLGMDTKQVIARFEAERQALAMMDHPNIARVLDAGATETGRPFFVMELVKGVSITEYCDQAKLGTKARLDLFMQTCRAVQHAHQKGIIHRDLKPSNVLVTLHDATPVPKVIDFGIAKATSHRLTEKTVFTEFRQFIGTPEYMSPDQAEISGLDVDTRTDIYSLGVMLYELITGTTPFDSATLRSKGYGEIQRMIKEDEPPVPSTRLNTMPGDALSTTATRQGIEPAALRRFVRGDLDWIIMRAMEKDRTRRYQTANEMVGDIERFLRDEPVLAGPPSTAYRFRKFIRRNRVGVVAGGLVLAALMVGLSLAAVFFVQAQREAHHSREVSDFLQKHLVSVNTDGIGQTDIDTKRVLARSRELFGEDHAVVAGVLYTWAANLRAAGHTESAGEALEQAMNVYRDAGSTDTLAASSVMGALAEIQADDKKFDEAANSAREALRVRALLGGRDAKPYADAMLRLTRIMAQAAPGEEDAATRSQWEDTIAAFERSYGPRHARTVSTICKFGSYLYESGQLERAEPVLARGVDLAAEVPGVATDIQLEALNSLTVLVARQGDIDKTMVRFPALLDMVEQRYGTANNIYISGATNYGMWLLQNDKADAAIDVLAGVIELAVEHLKPGDAVRLTAHDVYLRARMKRGDPAADLEELYARTIADLRLSVRDAMPLPLTFIRSLTAYAEWREDELRDEAGALVLMEEVEQLATKHLPIEKDRLGARATLIRLLKKAEGDHTDQIHALYVAQVEDVINAPEGLMRERDYQRMQEGGVWLHQHGFLADAVATLQLCTDGLRALGTVEPLREAAALMALGSAQLEHGEIKAALASLEHCLSLRRQELPAGNWLIAATRSTLGAALVADGQYEQAEAHILDGLKGVQMVPGTFVVPEVTPRQALTRAVTLYEAWGRPDDAATYRVRLEAMP